MLRHRAFNSAIAVSMIIHAVGFATLAAWYTSPKGNRAQFAGREQVIQLTGSITEPQRDSDPIKLDADQRDPLAVIKPAEVRIAKRRYVHSPTAELQVADSVESSFSEVTSRSLKRRTSNDVQRPLVDASSSVASPARRAATHSLPNFAAARPPTSLGNTEDTPPDFSENAPPTYPINAIRRGWEGTVLLRVSIDETGRVTQVEVVRSSGHLVLDGAAVNAVRQWKAIPANLGGKASATVEVLPVRFEL